MKIAVLGETRAPISPTIKAGGLGLSTYEHATALLKMGHDVTLFCVAGSEFDGPMKPGEPNPYLFDAVLDYSHHHPISQVCPTAPVLNLMGDRECNYTPPSCVVETLYMQGKYKTARIIPAGVNVDDIPFCPNPAGGYVVFLGAFEWHKGYHNAIEAAKLAGVAIATAGPGGNINTPGYRGIVTDAVKYDLLGNAIALLAPYTIDASPRTPLEAAATGTPTICLSNDGTKEHISEGVTGWACASVEGIAYRIKDAPNLDRVKIRAWVDENHNAKHTMKQLEYALAQVAGGERW